MTTRMTPMVYRMAMSATTSILARGAVQAKQARARVPGPNPQSATHPGRQRNAAALRRHRSGISLLPFQCMCHAWDLFVRQPADQGTAEDNDTHTDQPGLDDQDGSDGAVGDGVGCDQR